MNNKRFQSREIIALLLNLLLMAFFLSSQILAQANQADTNKIKSPIKIAEDSIWIWIEKNWGTAGLLIIGFLSLACWVWFKLEKPGWDWINRVLYEFFHPIPKAHSEKFTVIIANLHNDPDKKVRSQIVAGLAVLKEFKGIEIIDLRRSIYSINPSSSQREDTELARANKYLNKSGADILVWGSAVDEETAQLSWVTKQYRKTANNYTGLTHGQLPKLFHDDLKALLHSLILPLYSELDIEGRAVAKELTPFVDRLTVLLKNEPSFDPKQLTDIQFVLANANLTIGDQSGKQIFLLNAINLYRIILGSLATTDKSQRAMTQNNLGNALWTLGERESGIARLEEAVTAYRDASKERTRDQVPLDWAMAQNNLGAALRALGEREVGTERLEEAVIAYREALKEWTQDRVPLRWAMTQYNIGNALSTLGARESGTKRLEEAVTAYRDALKERTHDRVPLDWATTQNNLGNAQLGLWKKTKVGNWLDQALTSHLLAWKSFGSDASYYEEISRNNVIDDLKEVNEAGLLDNLNAALGEHISLLNDFLETLEIDEPDSQ